MRRMEVLGVRVEGPGDTPLLLLRERCDDGGPGRVLPIWVAATEAAAIAHVLEGITPPRPFTHDLMTDVLQRLGAPITEVRITELVEGTFYAVLVCRELEVSARPSDAIALALRVGAPVLCDEDVLAEAGVDVAEESESEVEKFREFLDHVTAEDFEES